MVDLEVGDGGRARGPGLGLWGPSACSVSGEPGQLGEGPGTQG